MIKTFDAEIEEAYTVQRTVLLPGSLGIKGEIYHPLVGEVSQQLDRQDSGNDPIRSVGTNCLLCLTHKELMTS